MAGDIVKQLRDTRYPGQHEMRETAADEIARLRGIVDQILHVCRDNAPEACNHRMALDFVHQVAASATHTKG